MDWTSRRYDAIVVGSGAAGGVAARCLTRAGADVLLLEAGPALSAEECRPRERPAAEFEAWRARQPVQSQSLWYDRRTCHLFVDDRRHPYTTAPSTSFHWIRSRQAGGRTLVWSRFALRLSPEDLRGPGEGGDGPGWPLSYEDLAPCYDRVERWVGVRGTAEGLAALPDGCFVPVPASPSLRALRARVESRWPDRHLVPAREAGAACADGAGPPSWSSLGSTLLAADANRLTLRTGCAAACVVLDRPDRAAGVAFVDRASGRWYEASGRVVLLCASTIESTRLLLASRTRDHPAGVGNSAGVLGRYLMDHVGGARVVAMGRLGAADEPRSERFYVPRFPDHDGDPRDFAGGYGIQGELQVQPGGSAVMSLGVFGEVLPRADNAVELDESVRDADGLPVPRIRFAYRDDEHRLARHAAGAVLQIVEAAGFRPMVVHDDVLAPGTRAHELGGARMGQAPADSVLDPFNRCWDVPNLFVTDGACFPTASYKGPTLTIMALTARACDRVLEGLRAGAY
jgi:choline dehydrogenase-like flavoprotein